MADNIETMKIPAKKQRGYAKDEGKANTRYAPSATINEHAYGKSGGKPNAIAGVPSVVVGGSSEVGTLPSLPGGNFGIGDNKNVSTPVSG
jgi:hypothetical protein